MHYIISPKENLFVHFFVLIVFPCQCIIDRVIYFAVIITKIFKHFLVDNVLNISSPIQLAIKILDFRVQSNCLVYINAKLPIPWGQSWKTSPYHPVWALNFDLGPLLSIATQLGVWRLFQAFTPILQGNCWDQRDLWSDPVPTLHHIDSALLKLYIGKPKK